MANASQIFAELGRETMCLCWPTRGQAQPMLARSGHVVLPNVANMFAKVGHVLANTNQCFAEFGGESLLPKQLIENCWVTAGRLRGMPGSRRVTFREGWRATVAQLLGNLATPAIIGLYTAPDITTPDRPQIDPRPTRIRSQIDRSVPAGPIFVHIRVRRPRFATMQPSPKPTGCGDSMGSGEPSSLRGHVPPTRAAHVPLACRSCAAHMPHAAYVPAAEMSRFGRT